MMVGITSFLVFSSLLYSSHAWYARPPMPAMYAAPPTYAVAPAPYIRPPTYVPPPIYKSPTYAGGPSPYVPPPTYVSPPIYKAPAPVYQPPPPPVYNPPPTYKAPPPPPPPSVYKAPQPTYAGAIPTQYQPEPHAAGPAPYAPGPAPYAAGPRPYAGGPQPFAAGVASATAESQDRQGSSLSGRSQSPHSGGDNLDSFSDESLRAQSSELTRSRDDESNISPSLIDMNSSVNGSPSENRRMADDNGRQAASLNSGSTLNNFSQESSAASRIRTIRNLRRTRNFTDGSLWESSAGRI